MPHPIPSVFMPAQGVASASSSRMSSASSSSAPSIAGGSRQRRLRRPRSIAELADLAEAGVKAMPFSSSIPVHRYLAGAENLIRQADAYSSQWQTPASLTPSDRWALLEDEWVCLVKAARLLVEILPAKHSGWSKLDAGARNKAKQTAESALERIGKLKVIANDEFEAWRAAHPDASLDDDPEEPPDKPSTTDRVPELKPKRSPAGSGGFDVRDLLGASPFTSSPLEPFSASHSKVPSSGSSSTKAQRDSALAAARSAARIPEKYSYPVLKATNTYRMSAHQATQGFAASTSLAGSYYAAPSATSSDGSPAQSTIRPQSSAQKPPIPSKYELKPGIPTKISAPGPRPLPLPGQSLASRPPLPTPTPAPAQQPAPSSRLRANMPHEASLRNLHAYERKPRPGDASLTRSQSRIALDVQDLLLQQQASGASAKSRSSGDTAASTARTEGGEALRTLRIPASIIDHFVAIADENTRANRETCGLLMGPQRFLSDGPSAALVVTHLTIPKQSATADTCTTEREEEIMEYQEREGLVTLGWIHTHPSQTCFMSSLDLHTHSSYQMMLPEAVAIVCAPNDNPSFGLFRLTSPPGLQTIVDCREPGLFHPHVKPDGSNIAALYTDAWGHAKLDAAGDLEIVDLR